MASYVGGMVPELADSWIEPREKVLGFLDEVPPEFRAWEMAAWDGCLFLVGFVEVLIHDEPRDIA